MFDVDHFKQVNDVYGHQAGDDVLVGLAEIVAEYIRNTDLLARWGGEEFVILAPGWTPQPHIKRRRTESDNRTDHVWCSRDNHLQLRRPLNISRGY